jgi:cobalt-zinc-cadmium efflux system membrane fusion protein
MTRKQLLWTALIGAIGILLIVLMTRTEKSAPVGEDEEAQEVVVRGPLRGRLLTAGTFRVEMTIFETGVEPIFRAYLYENDDEGKPLDPAAVDLVATVHRLGDRVDTIRFRPEANYLLGDQIIFEPHSFSVKVHARRGDESHSWEYEQLEGRVELAEASLKSSGVVVETAGPATLRTVLTVNGKIMPNEDKLAHVRARFPGVIRSLHKRLGEVVRKGDLLAVVESNESLQPYELRAPFSGTIVERSASPGELVTDNASVYAIADLGTVWADLNVHRKDFPRLKVGQEVMVDAGDGGEPGTAKLTYLSPFGAENTQTMLARAVLDNKGGTWKPGLFVKADITLETVTVPVAVKTEALQTFRDWDVVFIRDGDLFEARPLELGRRDGEWVEVLDGLPAGTPYVTGNSFLLKAELGKSGASHDH